MSIINVLRSFGQNEPSWWKLRQRRRKRREERDARPSRNKILQLQELQEKTRKPTGTTTRLHSWQWMSFSRTKTSWWAWSRIQSSCSKIQGNLTHIYLSFRLLASKITTQSVASVNSYLKCEKPSSSSRNSGKPLTRRRSTTKFGSASRENCRGSKTGKTQLNMVLNARILRMTSLEKAYRLTSRSAWVELRRAVAPALTKSPWLNRLCARQVVET